MAIIYNETNLSIYVQRHNVQNIVYICTLTDTLLMPHYQHCRYRYHH